MAISGPTSLPAYFNTDADFRAWGSGINAALAAVGLVQVSAGVEADQIDWTTVAKPGSPSVVQGYEIWQFNDTLQGSVPVFLKIEYGSGGNNATQPGIYMTAAIGGSNGSGSLIGQVGVRQQVSPGSQKSAGVTLPMYAFGTTGEVCIAVNVDVTATNCGILFLVERTKDNTGASTNDGIVYFVTDTINNQNQLQFIPASGGFAGAVVNNVPAPHPGFFSRSGAGALADVSPVFLPLGGKWLYMTNMLVLNPGDWPAGGTISVPIFGGTHTFMSLDKTCVGTAQWVGNAQAGMAMRWE